MVERDNGPQYRFGVGDFLGAALVASAMGAAGAAVVRGSTLLSAVVAVVSGSLLVVVAALAVIRDVAATRTVVQRERLKRARLMWQIKRVGATCVRCLRLPCVCP